MKFTLIAFMLFANSLLAQEQVNPCLDSLSIPTTYTYCSGDTFQEGWKINFHCVPEKFEVMIYNRWGQEIYTSKDYRFNWRAVDAQNKMLPSGVYFYVIRYSFGNEEQTVQGNISLIY